LKGEISREAQLNDRAENSHQLQQFASIHGQVSNLFMACRYNQNAQHKRQARKQAFEARETVTGHPMPERPA
jgi:putative transposase